MHTIKYCNETGLDQTEQMSFSFFFFCLRWPSWIRSFLLTLLKNQGAFFFFRLLFFQVIFFSFCFKIKGLSLTYQKVSSKNNLCFLVKLPTENSCFRIKIFYFNGLQLSVKISKKNHPLSQMFKNYLFYKIVFGIFLIQIIAREILIHVLQHIFRFWLE